MAPKRRFLKSFFCNFLGINSHNFAKNDPKLRTYLMQNFMELDMKKFADSKALKFRVWGLEIWAIWAQSLSQRTYQGISRESWLQFSQTRPHFLKNHEMSQLKSFNLKKCLELGVWGQETTFGPLGPRRRMQP